MIIDNEISSNSMRLEDLTYDTKLSTPFAVKVAFKIDKFVKSCLFSIEDEDIRLSLCFTPIRSDLVRTTLASSSFPSGQVMFQNYLVKENEWTDFLFYMDEDSWTLYNACLEISKDDWDSVPGREPSLEKLHLPTDSTLYMGRSVINKTETFEVRINFILKIRYEVLIYLFQKTL